MIKKLILALTMAAVMTFALAGTAVAQDNTAVSVNDPVSVIGGGNFPTTLAEFCALHPVLCSGTAFDWNTVFQANVVNQEGSRDIFVHTTALERTTL